jgi:DNA-binding transcriptional MerR regulator/methylmalonyl-CoA mutase cobalamin-binding subunit
MPERRGETKGARLSIGALSRATGIPVETLRTWESRYGFPVPERRPSGHRLYPLSIVPRLRRIAEALARGHRARQVVPASEADLQQLLDSAEAAPVASPPASPEASLAGGEVAPLLRLVESFQSDRLTHALLGAAARLGPLALLETVVAPLLRAVGEAWEKGRLEVRHEHFLSERLGDVLRSLRLPLEERASGPLVVFSTLPGEAHGLGLQMAALIVASAGCRVLYLGTETPVPDLASLTRDLAARALALSISASSPRPRTAALVRRLRGMLPRRTTLLLGGAGAHLHAKGVRVFADLPTLEGWARGLRKT